MIRRWIGWIFLIFLVPVIILLSTVISVLMILPIIVMTISLAGMLYLITKLGMHASPERSIKAIFSKTIGEETLGRIRDDLLIAFYPIIQTRDFEDLDKWSTLRQIDESRDQVIRRIAEGSSAISVVGGGISLVIGIFTGFGWALATFLLLVAVLISIGLVTIRSLTFNSHYHEFDSLEDLAMMKGWNAGPMKNGRRIAKVLTMILVISVFARPGSSRYETAMEMIQNHACKNVGIDPYRWHSIEDEKSTDEIENKSIESVNI